MPLQGAQDRHLLPAEVGFHPGREQAAHPVVMAQGAAVFHDPADDAVLEGDVLVQVHAGDEDEVEIGPLRVEVRGVRHADGARAAFDEGAHVLMQAVEVVPGDAGFERVDQDAEIVQVLAHVRLRVAGMFPFAPGIPGQGHGAVFAGDALDFARHQAGVVPVALDIAQGEAAAHGLETTEGEKRVHEARHAIEFQARFGFFRVRDAVDGGPAELPLHDLAAGVDRGLPGGIHEAEETPVSGLEAEDLHGDLDQDPEGALRALHDVVHLRAGGGGGIIEGLEGAGGGDELLAEHDVIGVAVIG